MDAEFRCMLPTFQKFRTKDDDIVTQSLEEQVSVSEIGYNFLPLTGTIVCCCTFYMCELCELQGNGTEEIDLDVAG